MLTALKWTTKENEQLILPDCFVPNLEEVFTNKIDIPIVKYHPVRN